MAWHRIDLRCRSNELSITIWWLHINSSCVCVWGCVGELIRWHWSRITGEMEENSLTYGSHDSWLFNGWRPPPVAYIFPLIIDRRNWVVNRWILLIQRLQPCGINSISPFPCFALSQRSESKSHFEEFSFVEMVNGLLWSWTVRLTIGTEFSVFDIMRNK